MMWLATAPVHTTGVNWESIAVIWCTILVTFFAAATYIRTSIRNNKQSIADQIDKSTRQMAEILNVRFEEVDRRLKNGGL